MIEYIERNFDSPLEKQKKQIIQKYKQEGKEVTYISGLGNGKIQVWIKPQRRQGENKMTYAEFKRTEVYKTADVVEILDENGIEFCPCRVF